MKHRDGRTQDLIEILDVYKESKMNGQAFAIFQKDDKLFGLMKPNEYSIKYHPILIGDTTSKNQNISKLDVIDIGGISLEEVDVTFQNSEYFLIASNFENPHLTIKLNQNTIKHIFRHFEKSSKDLQDVLSKQSITSHEALSKSKQNMLAKSKMMFIVDMNNDSIEMHLQNLQDIQVDEIHKNLVVLDSVLSSYQAEPFQIKQDNCVCMSRTIKLKRGDIRYIQFELDFLDVDILLENGFDTIEILDAFATTDTINSNIVLLRDYVCFKHPSTVNKGYKNANVHVQKDHLDFNCLVLPSYLKW
jgi:hypothetical protein